MSGWRVIVTESRCPALASSEGDRRYVSPPQSERQARALIALLADQDVSAHSGPWQRAVAGGRRVIWLEPHHP